MVLVTGRRHTFALPIAKMLGLDIWVISSNGAITRSLAGETFHRDMLPVDACRKLVLGMREFRGNTVLTFDTEEKGAIVIERMDELGASIQRWLEKNLNYIDFVIPIENSLVTDPVQAMFCGTIARMAKVLTAIDGLALDVTVLRTEYPVRDLSIVDVLNGACSKGHALDAGLLTAIFPAKRSWPSVITTTTSRCLPLPDTPLSWGMLPRNCGVAAGT